MNYARMTRFLSVVLFFLIIISGYVFFWSRWYHETEIALGCDLVWSDEFNTGSIPSENWHYRALGARQGAIISKEQVEIDGHSALKISSDLIEGKVHVGMVSTHKTFSKKFGFFEARVKLPKSEASRAAFWLQTYNIGADLGRPEKAGLEVDIFEYIANKIPQRYWLTHSLHWDGYGDHHKKIGMKSTEVPSLDGWNTFSLEWSSNGYKFYTNGVLSGEIESPVSKVPLYMILSLELSDEDLKRNSYFPDNYLVDYVKVYNGVRSNGICKHLN